MTGTRSRSRRWSPKAKTAGEALACGYMKRDELLLKQSEYFSNMLDVEPHPSLDEDPVMHSLGCIKGKSNSINNRHILDVNATVDGINRRYILSIQQLQLLIETIDSIESSNEEPKAPDQQAADDKDEASNDKIELDADKDEEIDDAREIKSHGYMLHDEEYYEDRAAERERRKVKRKRRHKIRKVHKRTRRLWRSLAKRNPSLPRKQLWKMNKLLEYQVDGCEMSHSCGQGTDKRCSGMHLRSVVNENPTKGRHSFPEVDIVLANGEILQCYNVMYREDSLGNSGRVHQCHTHVSEPGADGRIEPRRVCPGHHDVYGNPNYCLQVWSRKEALFLPHPTKQRPSTLPGVGKFGSQNDVNQELTLVQQLITLVKTHFRAQHNDNDPEEVTINEQISSLVNHELDPHGALFARSPWLTNLRKDCSVDTTILTMALEDSREVIKSFELRDPPPIPPELMDEFNAYWDVWVDLHGSDESTVKQKRVVLWMCYKYINSNRYCEGIVDMENFFNHYSEGGGYRAILFDFTEQRAKKRPEYFLCVPLDRRAPLTERFMRRLRSQCKEAWFCTDRRVQSTDLIVDFLVHAVLKEDELQGIETNRNTLILENRLINELDDLAENDGEEAVGALLRRQEDIRECLDGGGCLSF